MNKLYLLYYEGLKDIHVFVYINKINSDRVARTWPVNPTPSSEWVNSQKTSFARVITCLTTSAYAGDPVANRGIVFRRKFGLTEAAGPSALPVSETSL